MSKVPWLGVVLIGLGGGIVGALIVVVFGANWLGQSIIWLSWAIGLGGILMHNLHRPR